MNYFLHRPWSRLLLLSLALVGTGCFGNGESCPTTGLQSPPDRMCSATQPVDGAACGPNFQQCIYCPAVHECPVVCSCYESTADAGIGVDAGPRPRYWHCERACLD